MEKGIIKSGSRVMIASRLPSVSTTGESHNLAESKMQRDREEYKIKNFMYSVGNMKD